MTATAERKQLVTTVQPFSVQADHHNNSDLLLQAIPGCRLRSTISAARIVTDHRTGESRIPADRAEHLGRLPTPIPGQIIAVDPKNKTYEITDPLNENKDLCERLKSAINRNRSIHVAGTLRGVPTKRGTLDAHRTKTLCRELFQIVESGDAQVVKGPDPTMQQIDELDGKYLLNPGSQVRNSQPRFEEDFEPWADRLHM